MWAVELVHMVSVGGGTKKARGSIPVYYIYVLCKSIMNIQYRISNQLDSGKVS